jgi:hypothetical protein
VKRQLPVTKRFPTVAAVMSVTLLSAVPAIAQGRQGGAGGGVNLSAPGPAPAAGKPVPPPRLPSGRVAIAGSPKNGKGIWMPIFPFGGHLAPLEEVPFQPWAKKMYDERLSHQLEPHSRCKASGGVRQLQTPYGVELVEVPEQQRLYIFDIGGPHSYRVVYMDGSSHPSHPDASPYGHSIGWWDGDTLVIDTVGYNEGFWVDRRGLPGTSALRTVERFTRTLLDTIKYEITIDDPGAYTRAFTGRFDLRLDPEIEIYEYMCQESNYADEVMIGAPQAGSSGTAPTVP